MDDLADRTAFEAHLRNVERYASDPNVYVNSTRQIAWITWQAAAAHYQAEIAKLKAVVTAAAALVDQWEVEHDCPGCEAKAEAMGGRCAPTCDICLERWAVANDAYDDAREALAMLGGGK